MRQDRVTEGMQTVSAPALADSARTYEFATPQVVTDLSECVFYHVMDLPDVGTVGGDWDLRGRFEAWTFVARRRKNP